MISWKWACLRAQHTPIKVHFLIKTIFQIRCLHASDSNAPVCVLISIFWINHRRAPLVVGTSRHWWPCALFGGLSSKYSVLIQRGGHFFHLHVVVHCLLTLLHRNLMSTIQKYNRACVGNSCKCKNKAAITPSINIFWIMVVTCLDNSKKDLPYCSYCSLWMWPYSDWSENKLGNKLGIWS